MEENNVEGSKLLDIFNNIFNSGDANGIIIAENTNSEIKSKIFVKNNQVVYATSTMYRARFGDLMIKKGIITPKELNTALKLQKEHPKKPLIGNILVEMGIISERVIPNLLYHQIEVVIYEILSWKSANISFEETDIEKQPDYKRPISNTASKTLYSDLNKLSDSKMFVKTLKMNLDDLINIRKHMVNPDVIPKRIQKKYPSQLSFDQRKILRSIDGNNSLNDIIILSDLDYFRTYQIIYDLTLDKIISIPGVNLDEEPEKIQDDDDYEPTVYENPIQAELRKVSIEAPSYKKPTEDLPTFEEASLNDSEELQKYKDAAKTFRDEVKMLRAKLNEYENSSIVLTEEINQRVSRLPYHKKLMLSSILKNIMDMVESV